MTEEITMCWIHAEASVSITVIPYNAWSSLPCSTARC